MSYWIFIFKFLNFEWSLKSATLKT